MKAIYAVCEGAVAAPVPAAHAGTGLHAKKLDGLAAGVITAFSDVSCGLLMAPGDSSPGAITTLALCTCVTTGRQKG